MKRTLAMILTGVMMLMLFSGCGETATPSYEKVNNDVIDVTATDVFGEHSITILGDSMPHGAATVDIPNKSWPALLKKAINDKTGDNNYGFTSIEGTLWSKPMSYEMHSFPEAEEGFKNRGEKGDGWTEYRTAELLGTKGLGSSKEGASLTLSPQETFKYFCVYYQAGPDYGTFDVAAADGTVIASVDAAADEATYARTAMLDMSKLGEENQIVLTATSDKEVIFTGVGYYNTPDGVVVSNYSNGGLQLAGTGKAANGDMTGLDKTFLEMATHSGTMIFSLGYNDAYFSTDMELFEEKIDYLIECANKNGTKVIVNDVVWDTSNGDRLLQAKHARVPKVKAQLKRLAEETNGVYIDQQAIHGDAILATLDDGVHPNADGHAMLAASILEAMGLQEATA